MHKYIIVTFMALYHYQNGLARNIYQMTEYITPLQGINTYMNIPRSVLQISVVNMILSICDEPSLMNIIRIVVLLINIVKVVIPIVLIVFVMIKIMGAVSKHDQEEIMKTVKSCIPNVVAAVLIFLIPTFVDMVARLSFPNSEYSKCISGISREKVDAAYASKIDELVNLALETEKYSDYLIIMKEEKYLQKLIDCYNHTITEK